MLKLQNLSVPRAFPIKKISVKIRTQFSSSSPKGPELQELGSLPTLRAEIVPHMFSSISSPTDNASGFFLSNSTLKVKVLSSVFPSL